MSEITDNTYLNVNNEYDYFVSAQRDIMTISSILKNKDFDVKDNVETVCRCSAEAAEKMLRGWIIFNDNNADLYGSHDLEDLNFTATKYDTSFSNIENKILYLNYYTTNLRYSGNIVITNDKVKTCLEYLKDIYNFPLIKELRDKINAEQPFIKLPDNISTLFGEYGD